MKVYQVEFNTGTFEYHASLEGIGHGETLKIKVSHFEAEQLIKLAGLKCEKFKESNKTIYWY